MLSPSPPFTGGARAKGRGTAARLGLSGTRPLQGINFGQTKSPVAGDPEHQLQNDGGECPCESHALADASSSKRTVSRAYVYRHKDGIIQGIDIPSQSQIYLDENK